MFPILITAILMVQLNPALAPQKMQKPILPRIDQDVCPFEGCQFSKWVAQAPVQLYSTWKSAQRPTRMVGKGEAVRGVNGIHITLEPTEIKVTAPIPAYGLKPGDIVFGYMNIGEGFLNVWFNGNWVAEFDGSGID